jgi:hypothetical protein
VGLHLVRRLFLELLVSRRLLVRLRKGLVRRYRLFVFVPHRLDVVCESVGLQLELDLLRHGRRLLDLRERGVRIHCGVRAEVRPRVGVRGGRLPGPEEGRPRAHEEERGKHGVARRSSTPALRSRQFGKILQHWAYARMLKAVPAEELV